MSEETSQVPAATAGASSAPKSPKKKAAPRESGKLKSAPTHTKVSAMVTAFIGALKERGVDVEKLSPFIRKYLQSAVASGALVQTKGKGATNKTTATAKPKRAPAAGAKKPKKAAAKKPKAEKKASLPKSPKKPKATKKAPKKPASSKKGLKVRAATTPRGRAQYRRIVRRRPRGAAHRSAGKEAGGRGGKR
ncbi:hypothetical protein HPB48_026931 [Haemaphysalis longicornis]|uniref:H15 domain-containing protein n=1 Tax=Haemaphysalis longicornis TaxID=44386 RepID=A0A9J6HDK2_HAELO|nr:hypothetical protein HPB48_026931 [Haemaphysalis longicornis]